MKLILDEKEFFKLIEKKEQNIIFCFHNWSSYSIFAKQIVEEWELKSKREIRLIDASKMSQNDFYLHWLIQKESGDWAKEGIMTINKWSPRKRVHAYGEICWIRNKEVIGFEIIYDSFNSETLELRTNELF